MMKRTKGEQKAYLDGYEMCADCIEKYLTDEGKQKLECLLMAVRNAVEIEDKLTEESEEEKMRESELYNVVILIMEHIRPDGEFSAFSHNEVNYIYDLLRKIKAESEEEE